MMPSSCQKITFAGCWHRQCHATNHGTVDVWPGHLQLARLMKFESPMWLHHPKHAWWPCITNVRMYWSCSCRFVGWNTQQLAWHLQPRISIPESTRFVDHALAFFTRVLCKYHGEISSAYKKTYLHMWHTFHQQERTKVNNNEETPWQHSEEHCDRGSITITKATPVWQQKQSNFNSNTVSSIYCNWQIKKHTCLLTQPQWQHAARNSSIIKLLSNDHNGQNKQQREHWH